MALFSWVYLEQEKKVFVVFDLVSAYRVSDNELVAELGFAPGLSASHVAWLPRPSAALETRVLSSGEYLEQAMQRCL